MFNPDFFPTPTKVIDAMTLELDLLEKVVLEPQAGSGNILDYVSNLGAKTVACEKDPELAKIAMSKADNFLGYDFLKITSDMISHIDYIIMNPPFSADEKHILHAWEIALEGCVIKSLCNWETVENTYTRQRKTLRSIINENGNIEYLADCFSTSERQTKVNVALVTLFKPKSNDEDEFAGYFDLSEDHEEQGDGIIKYNEIRDIVNRYVGAVKMYDEVEAVSDEINNLTNVFGHHNDIKFGAHTRDTYKTITRDVYKKTLQKAAWYTVFGKLKMDKYLTKGVKDEINKFVEKQTNVPFKLKNVYRMIDILIQTFGQNMDKAIIEVFERITRHYHENRYNVEGWKTNSQYMINEKIIFPGVTSVSSGHFEVRWGGYNSDLIADLNRALCYLTATNYDSIQDIHQWSKGELIENPEYFFDDAERIQMHKDNYDRFLLQGHEPALTKEEYVKNKLEQEVNKGDLIPREFGKWYDWGFFEVKGFKKGTLHMKFKDRDVWATLNRRIAKIKGWGLPEKL